jgi:hypothetical protein
MSSEQIPADPVDILNHDCSLRSTEKIDLSFTPAFYAASSRVFRQLSHDLDEQQHSRARDRGSFIRTKRVEQDIENEMIDSPTAMVFKRTGGSIDVPELSFLGDFTKDLVKWIPNLQNNMNDRSPLIVHRFITVPLEDAMDQ